MADRLLFGLDNSMDFLNLVLGTDDLLIEERHSRAERHSSEVLPVKVSRMLADHGYTVKDLSCLLVTLGPGSFTGVRVALAFCKGLAEGLGIPLLGVPTLDVLAFPFAFMEGYYLCPLIDAKKGEVFFALYRVLNGAVIRVDGFHAFTPERIRESIPLPCLCFGTGLRLCRTVLEGMEGLRMIDGAFQRVSGEALLRAGMAGDALGHREEVKPIYGRRSEAEIKFNIDIR
ncbi:MAG: tRNA (adenosine(37)-N6)-threonylcarbamoyltransferase complex dimerization subunit type 1 TsaB [Syntrophorhabdales bacterium]|jgi:tRNA threonylcarbamoyladenosine biosynthesis protein TsaB